MAFMCFTYQNVLIPVSLASSISLHGKGIFSSELSPYTLILVGIIILVIVFSMVILQTRSLIRTRVLLKEKEEAFTLIEKQNSDLEHREKNTTDSLHYAQRIQEALLPSDSYFKSHFEDSFIFFRPKDIVSGDFYWIGEKNDKIFVVAADCTGHGVPGALMSMIGREIIDKTINEKMIEIPSEILAVLSRELGRTFRGGKNIGTIIRDGMDLGLCVINRREQNLIYSGAFFPLYMIRNNSLIQVKGDKINIGMNPENLSYTDHRIELSADDIFYLFSDGYPDQFGGADNKKFMYRRFRYLLLTIHRFSFDDQKAILEENLKKWMNTTWQVDDIMVIGFKPGISAV